MRRLAVDDSRIATVGGSGGTRPVRDRYTGDRRDGEGGVRGKPTSRGVVSSKDADGVDTRAGCRPVGPDVPRLRPRPRRAPPPGPRTSRTCRGARSIRQGRRRPRRPRQRHPRPLGRRPPRAHRARRAGVPGRGRLRDRPGRRRAAPVEGPPLRVLRLNMRAESRAARRPCRRRQSRISSATIFGAAAPVSFQTDRTASSLSVPE